MFVGVDEVAGPDGPAKRMADAQPFGQGFETGVGHLIDIADGAVGDRPDAAQRAVYVGVDLTPVRADVRVIY